MHGEESITAVVALATLTIGILLIIAKLGGELVERILRLPPVLGELFAGILISPYALGGLMLFGLGPVFSEHHFGGTAIPVSIEIYFVAQLAAVVLLFEAGLETNRANFFKYFKPATVVAVGGVLLPFALGFFGTLLFGFASFGSIQSLMPALFVGAAMTATSVGITARVLADMGSMSTPEGVTVMGAAVVDDVLGILFVAILVAAQSTGSISLLTILVILARAVGFLVVFTLVVSLFANRISKIVLNFRSAGAWLGIAFSIAFITAGVAEEYFGLALIIGAYAAGLALSDTHLKERVEHAIRQVSLFMAPLFFIVIGMQVDFGALLGGANNVWLVIGFAITLSVFGVLGKLFGSGLPAMLVGFNRVGGARIGFAMMPRGEVALIVASIGISTGVIDRVTFGFVVVMTVVTTVVAPAFLPRLFRQGGTGLRHSGVVETPSQKIGDS